MKIYHIALLAPGQPNTQVSKGLAEAGECYELDWLDFKNHHGLAMLREKIIADVKKIRPDIVFMQLQTADIIDAATAEAIKRISFIVNWTGDVRENIDWYIELADHIHLTLFTNMTDVKKMRAKGKQADYLQIGFDDTIYTPTGKSVPKGYPSVVFLGNNYENGMRFPLSAARMQLVEFMEKHFPQNFGVFGNGWNASQHLSPELEAECYRSCKIGINQNHFDYELFSSDRILRIMGCGAMCITKSYPGIEKEYIDGVHLVTYDTLDQLKTLVEYYLEHEDERLKIAESGRNLVRENYTWQKRMEKLFAFYRAYAWDFSNVKPFKTYSQNFEEAYLQRILRNVGVQHNFVLDIGAGDGYSISNSKFLRDQGFDSLLIDGNNHGNNEVKEEWITRENILEILSKHKCPQWFDLLSFDLDGNDFYILDQILQYYGPSVIIAEINPAFDFAEAATIQYDPQHKWNETDFYGMSLEALRILADKHDYEVVLVTDSLNAYLVQKELIPSDFVPILEYKKKNDFPKGKGQWMKVSNTTGMIQLEPYPA